MLKERNLKSKFESHHFDIQKLWAMNPATPFDKITNLSKKIKIQIKLQQELNGSFFIPKEIASAVFFYACNEVSRW